MPLHWSSSSFLSPCCQTDLHFPLTEMHAPAHCSQTLFTYVTHYLGALVGALKQRLMRVYSAPTYWVHAKMIGGPKSNKNTFFVVVVVAHFFWYCKMLITFKVFSQGCNELVLLLYSLFKTIQQLWQTTCHDSLMAMALCCWARSRWFDSGCSSRVLMKAKCKNF